MTIFLVIKQKYWHINSCNLWDKSDSIAGRRQAHAHKHYSGRVRALHTSVAHNRSIMMLAGAQIVDEQSVAYRPDMSVRPSVSSSHTPSPSPQGPQGLRQTIAKIPQRDPVDIHFSNITCTVSLGINKGKF